MVLEVYYHKRSAARFLLHSLRFFKELDKILGRDIVYIADEVELSQGRQQSRALQTRAVTPKPTFIHKTKIVKRREMLHMFRGYYQLRAKGLSPHCRATRDYATNNYVQSGY
jgi:hypothetical protein